MKTVTTVFECFLCKILTFCKVYCCFGVKNVKLQLSHVCVLSVLTDNNRCFILLIYRITRENRINVRIGCECTRFV